MWGEYGFLTITDTGEEYVPVLRFGGLGAMSGEQLLGKIKEKMNENARYGSYNADG